MPDGHLRGTLREYCLVSGDAHAKRSKPLTIPSLHMPMPQAQHMVVDMLSLGVSASAMYAAKNMKVWGHGLRLHGLACTSLCPHEEGLEHEGGGVGRGCQHLTSLCHMCLAAGACAASAGGLPLAGCIRPLRHLQVRAQHKLLCSTMSLLTAAA